MKNYEEKLQEIIDKYGNIIRTCDFSNEGIFYADINQMIEDDLIYKFDRGIYVVTDSKEDSDNLYLYQHEYPKGIVSGLSALYLHGFSIRTPGTYTFTFPQGYHNCFSKNDNVEVHFEIKSNYELGITEIETYYGNKVKAYDLERTLCDILRGQGEDIQIVNYAFKQYCVYPERNIDKLVRYAKKLHVYNKVSTYLQILL